MGYNEWLINISYLFDFKLFLVLYLQFDVESD